MCKHFICEICGAYMQTQDRIIHKCVYFSQVILIKQIVRIVYAQLNTHKARFYSLMRRQDIFGDLFLCLNFSVSEHSTQMHHIALYFIYYTIAFTTLLFPSM